MVSILSFWCQNFVLSELACTRFWPLPHQIGFPSGRQFWKLQLDAVSKKQNWDPVIVKWCMYSNTYAIGAYELLGVYIAFHLRVSLCDTHCMQLQGFPMKWTDLLAHAPNIKNFWCKFPFGANFEIIAKEAGSHLPPRAVVCACAAGVIGLVY